jgi:membrane fusion protein (multidrug efflux system)
MIPYFPSTMSLIALAQGELSINAARIGIEQLKQVYLTAQAQVHIAEDEARFQTSQRVRQEGLAAKGAASGTNLEAARHTEQRTQDQRDLAKQSVATALGGATDTPTDAHPSVQAAMVARDQAAYNLANATVNAPADGVIYQAASFKAGQMVAPGQSLFSLVETGDVWVDANFKEPQLDGIVAGRSATITFDANAGRIFVAVVEAVGAGTGSEFPLLPARNATGNWVKVTQRVPVRLRLLSPADAAGMASGIGAKVSVDTGHSRSLSELFGK